MQKSVHLETLLDWLYARINYERQSSLSADSFRLQTMRCLMERMGNPHLGYPVIHVAGTKGKGSVSAMVGQILSESGRKTGVYVSPHLEAINQRIMLASVPISDQDLLQVLRQLQPVVNQIDEEAQTSDTLRPTTFFEIITAAAMQYFSQQRVDAAVLEVGMGGRLDSTNVCEPQVSVITSISFDHMQQLGDTLAKIAFEKAGIIKPGVPVISGVPPDCVEPAQVIDEVARSRHSKLVQFERDFFVDSVDASPDFTFTSGQHTPPTRLEKLKLSMPGSHQRNNAAIAIAVCQELNLQGWNISESQIRRGLERAKLSGRTEVIDSHPPVVLDIAHNPASAAALVATLKQLEQYRRSRQKILILAISKDKDAQTMLAHLLPHFDRIILSTFICNPRARDPQELLELAKELESAPSADASSPTAVFPHMDKYHICSSSLEAWEYAKQIANEKDLICIAGSVFLVADLRPLLVA